MRLATYNIRHASLKGLDAVAAVLSSLEADLVALQEVDVGVARSDGVDQAKELGRALGLIPAFGKAFALQGGDYGVALLTRWPVLLQRLRSLPSPAKNHEGGEEPRVLLEVTLALPGGKATVAVTHWGLDPAERQAQAAATLRFLGGRPRVILAGDFNEEPDDPGVAALLGVFRDCLAEGGLAERRTYPASTPALAMDHVLCSQDAPRIAAARRVSADASDHLPVVVEFVVAGAP